MSPDPVPADPGLPPYALQLDGVEHIVTGSGVGDSLLAVLRDRLAVGVVKDGCRVGTCGSCAILVDGELRNACLVLAVTASGRRLLTAAGLDAARPDVTRAMTHAGAVQCGFCTPAMALAAHAVLDAVPDPSDAEIRAGLSGVQCRCAGYGRLVEAVLATARARASGATQDGGGAA